MSEPRAAVPSRTQETLAEYGLAAACYLAVVLVLLRETSGQIIGAGVDVPGAVWFAAYVGQALTGAASLTWTPDFFFPDGKDLFADTGSNFIDLLVAQPFRALWPDPGWQTPWAATLMAGNALAFHALARGLGASRWAAAGASLVGALHPYLIHEANGARFTQVMLWWWPISLRLLLTPQRGGRVRAGVGGALLGLQAWTYWFTAHFAAIVFAVPVLVAALRGGAGAWRKLGVSALAAGVVVAPALGPMLARLASGDVPDELTGAFGMVNSTLNPDAWWLLAQWASSLRVPGAELAVMGVALVLCRRRLWWWPAAVLGLLLVAGSRLHLVDGSLPNPMWSLAGLMPGWSRMLHPLRAWSALVVLGVPVLAEALDRLGDGLSRRAPRAARALGPLGAAGLGAGALVLLGPHPLTTTTLARPSYVDAVREAPGPVLDLPFPCTTETVHEQIWHGQPLLGGMAEHAVSLRPAGMTERLAADPLLPTLIDVASGRGRAHAGRATTDQARWVVFHKGVYVNSPLARHCWPEVLGSQRNGTAVQGLEALLGPPHVSDGLAAAWDLRALGLSTAGAPGP